MNFLKDKFSRGKKSSEQHQGNIKFSEDHPEHQISKVAQEKLQIAIPQSCTFF